MKFAGIFCQSRHVLFLLLLVGLAVDTAVAQLPNLRVGLPRDEDTLRQINHQV